MATYYEFDSAAVDDRRRRVAERTLQVACDNLGIGDSYRPAIRWFSEEDALDHAYVARWGSHFSDRLTTDHPAAVLEGRTDHDQNVVWLRATAPLSDLSTTVAHEVAHIAIQAERGPAMSPSERDHQEGLAEAYGCRYRRRYSL